MAALASTPLTLADGRSVVLRSAFESDADAIIEHRRMEVGAHDFGVLEPDELAADPDKQRAFIQKNAVCPQSLLLLALGPGEDGGAIGSADESVVGMLTLEGSAYRRIRHHVWLGMGVLTAWQGVGLGTRMLDAAIGFCRQHPVVEQIRLGTWSTNERALRMYERAGFEREGRRRDFVRFADGRRVDDIVMALHLPETSAHAGEQ